MNRTLATLLVASIAAAAAAQEEAAGSAQPDAPPQSESQPEAPPEAQPLTERTDRRATLTGERAGKFEGFYIRGGLGLLGFADSDYSLGGLSEREVEFDPGFGGSAAVGYDFGALFQPGASADEFTVNLRSEAAFSFERADADDVGGAGPPQLDELATYGLAFNTFVDFDTASRWTFYAGLGMGAAQVHTRGAGFDANDTTAFVQLLAGAIFDVSESASIYAGLRSRGYAEADAAGAAEIEDLASGTLEIGLMFSF